MITANSFQNQVNKFNNREIRKMRIHKNKLKEYRIETKMMKVKDQK